MRNYIGNIGIAISQMGNALLGGDPDETISSRCGKARKRCRLCHWLCVLLNRIDKNHCVDAIEPDRGAKWCA